MKRERCNAPMPGQGRRTDLGKVAVRHGRWVESCARYRGHLWEHRTAYALANAAHNRTKVPRKGEHYEG